MTKQPASCSLRKVLRLSTIDGRELVMEKLVCFSDCPGARISEQHADTSPPAAKPCRRRADRPWHVEFPAMAFGSADSDSRRLSAVPRVAPSVRHRRSKYPLCPCLDRC